MDTKLDFFAKYEINKKLKFIARSFAEFRKEGSKILPKAF
jgi:hypothetical protein